MSRLAMRGSIASFVVVGAVLAALLLGGLYVVKTQILGSATPTQPEVAVTESSEKKATDDAKNAQKKAAESESTAKEKQKNEQANADAKQTEESKQAAEAKKAEETAVAATAEADDSSKASNKETMPSTGVEVETLPTTGPSETIGTLLAVGLLAGAVMAYRRSLLAKV